MSAQFLKIMHQATQELVESGIGQDLLKVGTECPAFQLKDHQGSWQSSESLLEQGPLVLTFYRGFWCPYCNADLAHLQLYLNEIESAGARLLAVSPELPVFSRKIINAQKLTFDILFDEKNALAETFGIRFALPEPLKKLYRDNFNIHLKLYHGDDDWTLPVPARFVIDQQGIIRYAESNIDYRTRPEPDELINVLQALTE